MLHEMAPPKSLGERRGAEWCKTNAPGKMRKKRKRKDVVNDLHIILTQHPGSPGRKRATPTREMVDNEVTRSATKTLEPKKGRMNILRPRGQFHGTTKG